MTPDKIKKLRYSEGLSQKEFAKKLKVSIQCVQSWEQGLRKPSGMSVFKLEKLK